MSKQKANPKIKSTREVRNSLVQSRLNLSELAVFNEKAILYAQGEMSDFIRKAGLAYRPTRKVEK